MNNHLEFLDQFGSIQDVCNAWERQTGKRLARSTVQGWRESGNIPELRRPTLIAAGLTCKPKARTTILKLSDRACKTTPVNDCDNCTHLKPTPKEEACLTCVGFANWAAIGPSLTSDEGAEL